MLISARKMDLGFKEEAFRYVALLSSFQAVFFSKKVMRDIKENPRGLKKKHIWIPTWTVTDAWHTPELLTQVHQSLKLSTADNWSETGFTHISNTHTPNPPVTTLTFDLRWRRLLSDGADPFSVCEIISCQCHCEGQKGAKLVDLEFGARR